MNMGRIGNTTVFAQMKRLPSPVLCLWFAFSILQSLIAVDSIIYRSSRERSAYFKAFKGHVLQNHVFLSHHGTSVLECANHCLRNHACLSYNYKPISKENSVCQLNDANRVTCPECYSNDQDTIYHEAVQTNNCIGRDGEVSNYDLYFPHKSVTSFVNQTWSVNLGMFTICFWMQTADTDEGALFSYATSNSRNEITIFKHALAINYQKRFITGLENYYDGSRHHVCITWSNTAGTWNMTVDGKIINSGSGFQAQYVIPGGGYLAIGQEQDIAPGDPEGFNVHQSFMGRMSGLNVWSEVLPNDEILRMSKACNMGSGDVLKWSDFLLSKHGEVFIICPSTCKI